MNSYANGVSVGSADIHDASAIRTMIRVLSGVLVKSSVEGDRVDFLVFRPEDKGEADRRIALFLDGKEEENSLPKVYWIIISLLFGLLAVDSIIIVEVSNEPVSIVGKMLSIFWFPEDGIVTLIPVLNYFTFLFPHGNLGHLLSNVVGFVASVLYIRRYFDISSTLILYSSFVLGAIALPLSTLLFHEIYMATDPSVILGASSASFAAIGGATVVAVRNLFMKRDILACGFVITYFLLSLDKLAGGAAISDALHYSGMIGGIIAMSSWLFYQRIK